MKLFFKPQDLLILFYYYLRWLDFWNNFVKNRGFLYNWEFSHFLRLVGILRFAPFHVFLNFLKDFFTFEIFPHGWLLGLERDFLLWLWITELFAIFRQNFFQTCFFCHFCRHLWAHPVYLEVVLTIVPSQLYITLLRWLVEAHSYRALLWFSEINLKILILEYLVLATFIKLDLFPRPQVQDRLGIVESVIFRHLPLKVFFL